MPYRAAELRPPQPSVSSHQRPRRRCGLRRLAAGLLLAAGLVALLEWSYAARPPPPGTEAAWAVRHVLLTPLLWALRHWGPALRGPCLPAAGSVPCLFDEDDPRRACLQGPRAVEVVTGSTRELADYERLCRRSVEAYAQAQGYALFDASARMRQLRATLDRRARDHWLKVLVLAERLQQTSAEWLLWLDTDVVVADPSVGLERVVAPFAGDASVGLVLGQDDEGINSGVLALRRSPAGAELAAEWKGHAGKTVHRRDQGALREIFNRRTGLYSAAELRAMMAAKPEGVTAAGAGARGFGVLRQCAINSTPLVSLGQETFMVGDWLVHFYSLSAERKQHCVSSMLVDGLLPGSECT